MVKSSSKKRSPLSVVSPAKTGRTMGGAMPFEPGIEVEREFPSSALARDDDVAPRPDVRPGGEVELGVEIVERAGAVEGELHRRQAREVGEMGEHAARGLIGIDGEGELVGGWAHRSWRP